MIGKKLALIASMSLAATPALAQPSASALSIQPGIVRAEASQGANDLDGGANWFPALLAAAIVIGGILLATGVIFDNDHDTPASP